MRQRRARQAERTARCSALAFARWRQCRGLTRSATAHRLGLSASALSRWVRRWKEDRMTLRPRGRPIEDLDRETRAGILSVFSLMGPHATLAALRDLFPDVARGALENLLERCRSVYRRRSRWLVHTLRWTRPGTVWATDFTQPPALIDGVYPRLLLVRDLASGRQLLGLPCPGESADLVVAALRFLFQIYGPPLVLKMDNGSAFISAEVEALLQEHGVFALFSPPGTPAYNGSVEAGIGSLEVRAFYESARHDRPGEWTCDDGRPRKQAITPPIYRSNEGRISGGKTNAPAHLRRAHTLMTLTPHAPPAVRCSGLLGRVAEIVQLWLRQYIAIELPPRLIFARPPEQPQAPKVQFRRVN